MIEPIGQHLNLLDRPVNNTGKEINKRNSFVQLLKDNINEVNVLQREADEVARDFSLGKVDNVHQVTIAAEKARVALKLTLAIQSKVVDAYKEIMRMQV